MNFWFGWVVKIAQSSVTYGGEQMIPVDVANLVVFRLLPKLGTIPTFILSIVVKKSPQMMMHFASSQKLSKSSIRNLTSIREGQFHSFSFLSKFSNLSEPPLDEQILINLN